jgi:hypothetical protein
MNTIPMRLMIQRQRLKLFGHIGRMKDDRQVKQLLFWEIDGVRFIGRPNMKWIDCINEVFRGGRETMAIIGFVSCTRTNQEEYVEMIFWGGEKNGSLLKILKEQK